MLALVVGAVVIQVGVLDRLAGPSAVRVDLPLLVVVAVALVARLDEAAVVGFAGGLLLDLVSIGPFGLHALIATLGATAAAAAAGTIDPGARRWSTIGGRSAAAAGMAAAAPVAHLVGAAIVVPTRPSVGSLVASVSIPSLLAAALAIQVIGPLVAGLATGPSNRTARRPFVVPPRRPALEPIPTPTGRPDPLGVRRERRVARRGW